MRKTALVSFERRLLQLQFIYFMFQNNQHNALVTILFDIRGGKTEQRNKMYVIKKNYGLVSY